LCAKGHRAADELRTSCCSIDADVKSTRFQRMQWSTHTACVPSLEFDLQEFAADHYFVLALVSMAVPLGLVAPQTSSRHSGRLRVLLASALCVILVAIAACGYHSRTSLPASTSLLLRDGVPNDREIEFESSVCPPFFWS
jgi:hypothetical protein